jgi:nitrogen-specific signal transduction histidine kinase
VRDLLRRPTQLLASLFGLALLVALGLLVAIAWRGIERLEPLEKHLEQQVHLAGINRSVRLLNARPDNPTEAAKLRDVRNQLAAVIDAGEFSDAAVPDLLRSLQRTLSGEVVSAADLELASSQIEQVLDSERAARQTTLTTFKRDAKVELALAVGALLVLPTTALLVFLLLRERISQPLRDLNSLLALIGEGRRRPALKVGVQLRPIMESYNRLVDQLSTAVTDNQKYQVRLESMVQDAAGALIRQQHDLAEADRLAAVGEISAHVAHELKNPLAGIQIALVNLSEECKEPDKRERLDLVCAEVSRMARLLDQLLTRPNRRPEPRQNTNVRLLVDDVLSLVRYQILSRITVVNDVSAEIQLPLQRDCLRQVLLNLVLNSAQAIANAQGTIVVTAINGKERFSLSVTDDGPGFPLDILEQGIRPFVSARLGGTGLGLSTVQRLARTMGGRLELANRQSKGSIATLVIASDQQSP